MNRDIEIVGSDRSTEQRSVDAKQLRSASMKEVLLWEAT
jgi:hypothetical protein